MEHGKHQKRVTRPRKKDVDYHEPAPETLAVSRVPYKNHAQACLTGNFGRLKPLMHPGYPEMSEVACSDLTVDLLRSSGFQDPVLVHAEESISGSREALGMSVPEGLSPGSIAAALGPDTRVPTIDVETQTSGPRMTLAEWAQYYDSDEKDRLLNVVSLSLAGTPLQDEVIPPAAVTGLNLVDAVWPAQEKPRPEVLLYGLMSPAGCYTDFHVDFGGSSIWYHVVKGRKTFILAPPTPQNMKAFEEWSSSDRQGGIFYADRAEGCLQATLNPGSTLLIPSSWPHAVVTQEDAMVVGGNFLHALELRRAVECWEMESRLKVHASARFPLFEPLLWHTVAHYRQRLLSDGLAGDSRPTPSAWELTGLVCVLSFLKRQMDRGDWFYCPKSIDDPEELLRQTEQAASGLVPEDILPDLFSDLDPLDPDPVSVTPGDLLLDDSSSLLDDLGGGVGLPLPDVASPHWLGGMGPSNSDPGEAAGGAPSSGDSEEVAEEAQSSGDEWTARKRSRATAAQRATRQRLNRLRAAKAVREEQKGRAAEAARRLAASEGEGVQQDSSAAPSEPVITMKASARVAQAAREDKTDSKRGALRAQMMVLHLRSRIQKELGMQVDAASGKLQLKDSGARLQEGISETAARLAQVLSTLAQHDAAEPHWPPQCFQSSSLHFIDADGQVQGPFSAEHMKVLQESGAVQDDTLVMAAAKGPSLLKEVLLMHEKHKASPSARSPEGPTTAQSGPKGSRQALANSSLNGHSTVATERMSQSMLRPGHTPTSESKIRQDSANSSRHQQNRRDRSRQDSNSRSAGSRAASDAAEAQRKIEQARARRAQEQRRQEEARRRAHEEHRCRAAQVAAQRHQSKPSWAEQAAAELAQAELAGDGAYQGSWTFTGSGGQEMGPYIKSELIAMHESGKVDGKTMVYDEEDGVMIELSALVASAGGSGRRPSPELPAMPEPHAQLPEEVIHASAAGLAGSAKRHSVKEQLYSALDGDEHGTSLQATPSARPRSPKRSTGQYLPGLAPATEVRKRAAELREQHLAKLKRLAGSQREAASGEAGQTLGLAPASDGTPPPPPPLPLDLLQTGDAPGLWRTATAGPVPAHDQPARGTTQPGTSQHAVALTESSSASHAALGREANLESNGLSGHLKPAAAPPWQRQQGHDSSSMAPSQSPSSSGWWQQQVHHGQQGQHFGHRQESQTGQYGSTWQLNGAIRPERVHSEEQRSFYGGPQTQTNGWHGSSEPQALGAGTVSYAGQPGNLGSVLQGIMTSVHSIAGASLAHLDHAPSPGHMGWPPHDNPQYPTRGHMAAVGQTVGHVADAVQRPEAMLPYQVVHPQQPSQQGVMGDPWYSR